MTTPAMSGASVKALWDMTRCRFDKRWQYEIKQGVNILNEVTFLVREGALGGQVVKPCTGVAGEQFAGVALHSGIQGYVWAAQVTATVPSVAPYTIDVAHKNLMTVAGSVPLVAATLVTFAATPTVPFIVSDPATPPAGSGTVSVDYDTGIYTFDVLDAGQDVVITYRWNLSAIEHQFMMRESHINRGCEALYNIMTVGVGHCEVYTMMYDARAVWVPLSTVAGDLPVLAPNGEVTTAALNGVGVVIGKVIKAPTPDDPYLGIEYTTW